MAVRKLGKAQLNALHRFRSDERGLSTMELVIVLPILIWAYMGMTIFYDGYRARLEAQSAALHIADLISRQQNEITTSYLDGMNDVFDFLTTRPRDTRLRISSIMYDPVTDRPAVVWSYGTRGLPALPQMANLDDLIHVDLPDPEEGAAALGFDDIRNQLPVADLADRIPAVVPGEALVVVEAFALWNSPIGAGLDFGDFLNIRLTPVAVTRPRFTPFVRFENDGDVFPADFFDELPEVGEIPPPVDDDDDAPPDNPADGVTIIDTDFTDGNTQNWSQDQITHSNTASGSFLGPFGRETRTNPLTFQVNLGQVSQRAVIEFDLFIIDSWDGYDPRWSAPSGDVFLITVNGAAISASPFQMNPAGMLSQDRSHVVSRAEGRFTTTMTLVEAHRNLWGGGWNDQIWRVRIVVDNPATQFTLGFIADVDEPIHNESFGFQRFRVAADPGAHSSPGHFVPSGRPEFTDSFTRFNVHRGCPEPEIGTKTQHLRVQDLWSAHRFRIEARGQQQLHSCNVGVLNNSDFSEYRTYATPHLVLHWDNQGQTANGSHLRISTNDGNRGFSCDAILLVRSPTGQWQHNGWIRWRGNPSDDWNARLNLGPAQSGTYHIWVGRWGSGTCNTDLVIETY